MDATKVFEDDLTAMVKFGREVLRDSADNLAPYPMGVVDVSLEDQRFDFDNRGPDYCQTLLGKIIGEATTSGRSIGDAALAFMKHIAKMQENSNA